MVSRTRWGKRTGSSSLSSSLLCWRSDCQHVMACSPTFSCTAAESNLLGKFRKFQSTWNIVVWSHSRQSPLSKTLQTDLIGGTRPSCPSLFWKWWHTQLIDNQWYTLFPISLSDPEWHVCLRCFEQFCPCCKQNVPLSFPHQVIVGEGSWGRHRTAQILGERKSRDVTGFESPLGRRPTFPLRAVSLREGGRRVVGEGG